MWEIIEPPVAKLIIGILAADDNCRLAAIDALGAEFGKIDFLLHSVAFADRADLNRDTIETSRDGFKMAMEVSAYSLLALANGAKDVLKDGASAAIYGSRAAFGVILIQTKQGKKGSGFKVNYNNNFGFASGWRNDDYLGTEL